MLSRSEFVKKHLELIELEENAEMEENKTLYEHYSLRDLRMNGHCLLKVRVQHCETGMFGRNLVTLESVKSFGPSPNLKSGDLVGLSKSKNTDMCDSNLCGVITDVKTFFVTVALDKPTQPGINEIYHLFRMGNLTTYKRMRKALRTLRCKKNPSQDDMIDVLFGQKEPSAIDVPKFSFVNEKLNEKQKEAVRFALSQKEVAVIHGPPGTGKTTTVVEIILQLIKQGLKVLACAPSNVAADNLVENLAAYTTKLARLGHPARTLPGCQNYNIDFLLSNCDNSKIIKDVESSINLLTDCLETGGFHNQHKRSLQGERRKLQVEARKRLRDMTYDVLKNCEVIVSTLTSASNDGPLHHLPCDFFDVAVIDECPQAVEAACWIPLLIVNKCILAGDHMQLPPVILSEEAEKNGLMETLMERVIKIHGDSIKKLLTLQYRMHQEIMKWPSEQLYEGQLQAHESVASHLLRDIPGVEDNENTSIPLLLIDTAGCDMWDFELNKDESKGNEGEADLVAIYVAALIKSGLNAEDIAVITPYSLQVELLKARLSEKYADMEIRSVDGFQGREKQAVVLSLVRSNTGGHVGFLKETRRINVAITRAKRHLAVICDSQTVSHHPFLQAFVEYLQDKGEVRSAAQYQAEISSLPECHWRDIPHLSTESRATKKVSEKCVNGEGPKMVLSHRKRNSKAVKEDKLESSSSSADINNEQRGKYIDVIEAFLHGCDTSMTFPSELSSYDRLLIHEVAEEMKLNHKSVGIGSERSIVVSKPIVGEGSCTETNNMEMAELPLVNYDGQSQGGLLLKSEISLQDEVQSLQIASDITESSSPSPLCPEETSCDELITDTMSDSHLPTTTSNSMKPKKECGQQKPKNPPVKKKSKKPLKPSVLENTSTSDFDTLIETAVNMDSMCKFSTCKNTLKILLQTCQYCKFRFCLTHHLPEIHGCGSAAKAHARSMVRKEGMVYPGSGKPERKQDSVKHAQLQRKLENRLSELSKKRKQNPKK